MTPPTRWGAAARRALLPLLAASLCPTGASALSLGLMQERTAVIGHRYLEIWSSNDGSAVADVPYMYGPTVQFYGRTYSQRQLLVEKRRAIRQWPVRRYAIRPGTLKVTCNAPEMKCGARATTDFEVADPSRGTGRRGSARFDLGVSFAEGRPRILYEGGSLNRRRPE